ncbi:hypothetical protein RJT34_18451 [Clitoria ternatea]|uniref:F-box domain-containing protein n=1 Tax=Clitoria ternatea TaxID=43366 RepID=A0AAN9JC48_CLITE
MKCKAKKRVIPELPHDLIGEILQRLCVKSLMRFKCVSKLWLSLISDPQFAEWRFELPANRLLFQPDEFGTIKSLDVEASLHDDSATVQLPLPLPSSPIHNTIMLMGSCRGLVLFNYEECGEFMLWNPLVGFQRSIPHTFRDCCYPSLLFGFGYDASTNDYMVVFVELSDLDFDVPDWPSDISIFSLRDNSWNNGMWVGGRYEDIGDDFKAGSFLNGALHWLVLRFSDVSKVPFADNVIIAFDLKEKTLAEIALPPHLADKFKYQIYSLRVLKDCLCVCCVNKDDETNEIWMMEEYKVLSSWTKCFVVSDFDVPFDRFSPICFTKNGEILGLNMGGRIEKRNDKGELIEHLTFHEVPWFYGCNAQSSLYTGRLVSLP